MIEARLAAYSLCGNSAYYLIVLVMLVIPGCSYPVKTRYHNLDPVSPPLVVNEVTIIPSFYASPKNKSKFESGAPWHLMITSVGPTDATDLSVHEAIAKGDGWQISLHPKDKINTGTYRKTADGLTWLQFSFDDVSVDKPMTEDATFQVIIRGTARLKDREFPVEGSFIFKSVITTETVYHNPFVDR
jgi:hypothetical protein